ncbi:MFS transporter [Methanobrevibacter sp.]|uniref:MFS transporter n=1 Tax=Methanobrevibacter sp. TaxID=66852 RepID=UPI003890DAB9
MGAYNKKILITLFFITFSLSTLLSVSGLSNEIAIFYGVPLMESSLYLGGFLFIIGITALFFPSYFSRYEKKQFFILSLVITVITTFIQIFVSDFIIVILLRIIPTFFYSTAISFTLTYISKINPNEVNKVVLGITSGAVFGASISVFLTTNYGYNFALLWIASVNLITLVLTILFLPKMKGVNECGFIKQFSIARSKLFAISVCSILFIGVGVSVTYNFFTLLLETITLLPYDLVAVYIFFNGIASVFGTSLIGKLMQKNLKLTVTLYPIVFIALIITMLICIELDNPMFVIMILFGILDGSMQTIAQYTISSAAPETPEFANGFYLFIVNLNRTIGIILGGFLIQSVFTTSILVMSMISFALSVPFIIYRFNKCSMIDSFTPESI